MFQKSIWGPAAMAATLMLGLPAQQASAASVQRTDFSPLAVNFDLGSALDGTVAVTDGVATFSGGGAISIGLGPLTGASYWDGVDSSVIRLDFSGPVAGVGMDFVSNNADVTLSVFDASDSLLESVTVAVTGLSTIGGYPTGFIGIGRVSADISWLTIDTPLNGNELYVDNVIYGPATVVPVPAALPLLATALLGAGLYSRRRRG